MKKKTKASQVQVKVKYSFYDSFAQKEQTLSLTITQQPTESLNDACMRYFTKLFPVDCLIVICVLNKNQWEVLL